MNTSTEIIQKITSKPDWKIKILTDEISNNWIREICENGYDHNFVFNIMDILKKYSKFNDTSSNLEYYDWFVRTDFVIDEVVGQNGYKCGCDCLICQGKEYKIDQDEDEDDEYLDTDDEIDINNITPHENCKCLRKTNENKKTFINKYITQLPNLIGQPLKDNFIILADKLPKTNFHPGSNNQMVDLFHPSIFPYIKGISDNKIDPTLFEQLKLDKNMIFQWLPSEISIRYLDTQTESKIKSYINNLSDSNLVEPIEQIFNKFVPHFNNLLDSMYVNNLIETKTVLTDCQVIIKAQEINLEPSKPVFSEGSWHLEGTKNEHIIATGIYYYEMTNLNDNYLNFRVKVSNPEDIYYPQNCTQYVKTHYGFDNYGLYDSHDKIPCISLDSVKTYENLCLVFPNTFQHKVSKISLTDPTKNGSRKILVFFLIDPNNRIISTADIEPQQNSISETNAKIYQDILMFERKYESKIQTAVFEREWSLCEH